MVNNLRALFSDYGVVNKPNHERFRRINQGICSGRSVDGSGKGGWTRGRDRKREKEEFIFRRWKRKSARPFLSSSLSTFPRSSLQAGYEAGPMASTIRVRTSTSSSICPRATQRPYSLCLAGFRFAPLVYLFAYLFLGPLTLVYFSYSLFLPSTLSLYTEQRG